MSVVRQQPVPGYQRILVRGVNWLGDAVMTTPALLRLRQAQPSASIALLTPEKLADLWQNHPAVDAVLCIDKGETVWHVGQRLREQQFEVSLILPNSPRSALEGWLAGIPRRVGYSRPWRDLLLTERVSKRPEEVLTQKRSVRQIKRLVRPATRPGRPRISAQAHHIHHYLHLANALGADREPVAPLLHVTQAEAHRLCQNLNLCSGQSDAPFLAVNPGAEYGPAKRWPVEKFAAVIQQVQMQTGLQCLILGGLGDTVLADELFAALKGSVAGEKTGGTINLAGRTTLRELMVLLRLCRVLLTNDTGPMHVAAALGTPVVALFGSTSAELTAPGLPNARQHQLICSDVPCAPCFRRECPIDFRCMQAMAVEQVVKAVLRSLELPRPR